jgi:flagellar operon protein
VVDVAQRIQQSFGAIQTNAVNKGSSQTNNAAKTDFAQVLKEEQAKSDTEIKYSAHAQMRLQERNLVANSEVNRRLSEAMQKLLDKGGKESLVLMDNLAFVVSAPSRTVITAMDSSSLKNNVFTQIDSAVIM